MTGEHHETCLSDYRRTAPQYLTTLTRQPML